MQILNGTEVQADTTTWLNVKCLNLTEELTQLLEFNTWKQ